MDVERRLTKYIKYQTYIVTNMFLYDPVYGVVE
jgi:hypothetical protein